MSSQEEAQAHLTKAREFLEAAVVNHELKLHSAATSNAVTAGISAKEAICLLLTGKTGKTDNHNDARAELTAAGSAGKQLEPTLARLLRLKTKAQYQSEPVAAADAARAITWAARMVEGAGDVARR